MSPSDDREPDVAKLLGAYRASAERWDELQNNAKAANRVFDKMHKLYKHLRVTEAGRQGIANLMTHPSIGVRLTAATDSLEWAPDEAVAVLEAIEAGPGLHAVTAKYTLLEYRKGTLNLDW